MFERARQDSNLRPSAPEADALSTELQARDGAYPTEIEFENFVGEVCLPAFDEYVGLAYEDSRLEVYWYYPLEDGWNEGDHLVQCAIYDPLESDIVGSLRGAAY